MKKFIFQSQRGFNGVCSKSYKISHFEKHDSSTFLKAKCPKSKRIWGIFRAAKKHTSRLKWDFSFHFRRPTLVLSHNRDKGTFTPLIFINAGNPGPRFARFWRKKDIVPWNIFDGPATQSLSGAWGTLFYDLFARILWLSAFILKLPDSQPSPPIDRSREGPYRSQALRDNGWLYKMLQNHANTPKPEKKTFDF